MRLSTEDVTNLILDGRLNGMPEDSFVGGFIDIDGSYYPIEAIDASYYAGRECLLYTHLAPSLGGVEFYLCFA